MLYYNKDYRVWERKEGAGRMSKKEMPVIQSASELKQHVERLVRHDYLQIYIDNTLPDEHELWLVFTILKKRESDERALAITLAWGFVYAGLAIHELVSLHNKNDEESKKRRQLNVLAGDFYSSLYYQSLAGASAVDMVELFGSTLQDIYEHKMASYMDESATSEVQLQKTKESESLLLVAILERIGELAYKPLIQAFFLHKWIRKEEKRENVESPSSFFYALKKNGNAIDTKQLAMHKEQVRSQLNDELDKHANDDEAKKVIQLFLDSTGGE